MIAGFQGIHQRDRPPHHARARRLRIPRRWRSPPRSRPTAAISTPTSTASTPPTRGSCRRRSRLERGRLRGDAGDGLARRKGASGALGRARHGRTTCRTFVRSSFDKPEDIDAHSNQPPGTLICSGEEIVESHVVTGIAFSKDEAQISMRRRWRISRVLPPRSSGRSAEAGINVDMIVQNISADGKNTDLTFTVTAADYRRAAGHDHRRPRPRSATRVSTAPPTLGKVSVIGSGMRSHAGVAAQAFTALRRSATSTSAPSPPPRSSFRS